jgi:hypothetical protein
VSVTKVGTLGGSPNPHATSSGEQSSPTLTRHASPETEDLFALGRQASAARDARAGRRGSFARARQLVADGSWRGPRDAAESWIDEADVPAAGGIAAVKAAGVDLLLAGRDPALAAAAADVGLRVVWRVSFREGESDADRLQRWSGLATLAPRLWGVMPSPVGEPYGLDALRCFALARLALPEVPHLLSDVAALGPRLAQMAFGFGADELWAPIVAERALRLGDNASNPALTRKEAATLIRGAGLAAYERLANGAAEEVPA